MSILSINTYEHLVEDTVVSCKIITFCGIPIYNKKLESSNYNYVGQFDVSNFTNNNEESENKTSKIYKQTNIGFNHEEQTT